MTVLRPPSWPLTLILTILAGCDGGAPASDEPATNDTSSSVVEGLAKSGGTPNTSAAADSLEALLDIASDSADVEEVLANLETLLVQEVRDSGGRDRFIIEGFKAQPGVPSSSFTMQGMEGGLVQYTTEFAHDGLPFNAGGAGPQVFGDGSVHRFDGQIAATLGERPGAIVGTGSRWHRFTFAVLEGIGWVYLRGEGTVVVGDPESGQVDVLFEVP